MIVPRNTFVAVRPEKYNNVRLEVEIHFCVSPLHYNPSFFSFFYIPCQATHENVLTNKTLYTSIAGSHLKIYIILLELYCNENIKMKKKCPLRIFLNGGYGGPVFKNCDTTKVGPLSHLSNRTSCNLDQIVVRTHTTHYQYKYIKVS